MKNLIDNLLTTSLKERELVYVLWFGFIIYTLSFTLSTTTLVSYSICQLFQVIGLLLFLPTFFFLLKFQFENTYIKILFSFYLFWIAITIGRGISLNYNDIKIFAFDAWFGGILYLSPIFLLLPQKLFYLKRIFDVIIILGAFYVLYDVAFIKHLISGEEGNLLSRNILEYFSKTLAVPCFFLLMLYRYFSGRKKLFLIFIFLLTVSFAIIGARRGLLLMCGLTALFAYLLYLNDSHQKLSIILLSGIAGGILLLFGFEFLIGNQNGMFHYIIDRGLEDTRSTVELCFYQDMSTKDWLIGKGMNGEYFCPGIDPDDTTGYRYTIETDYLQIILKGGLISLTLFLLITIPAIFKGLFYSNNLLSKAAGIWILWILLNMYPSTVNTFTMQFILLWISVKICYSPRLREIPDQFLVDYFRGYKNSSQILKDFQNYKSKETSIYNNSEKKVFEDSYRNF